ncbi:L-seryl-tRNA(Sec) selenium transferase [Bacillus sp. AK031]
MKDMLRKIPSIHEIQNNQVFAEMIKQQALSEEKGTELIKPVVGRIREEILEGTWKGPLPGTGKFIDYIVEQAARTAQTKFSYTLKKVINASGTILHTNLGRARMSDRAVQHVVEIARNYSNLEYDIEKGVRGSRHTHAETLLKEVTGAEAAMVVNNNAAAVFLILSALAKDKEVIVSRGELVEIGGSFRVSSIMEESGARLIEVGTTNKTRVSDYEMNITEETAMVMKVHRSNFVIKGFTEEVHTEELARLSVDNEHVIFYEDLGSGMLYDLNAHNIGNEPLVKDVISKGADIVSFSGDKLLGGPQAGIIAGKQEFITLLKKHQLARVLRVDKMTLAALEGTLIDYLKDKSKDVPSYKSLLMSSDEIKARAEKVSGFLSANTGNFLTEIKESKSQVGGGTMPEVELDTYVLSLKHKQLDSSQLEKALRKASVPIIGRVHREELLLDFRTVETEEIEQIMRELKKLDEPSM